MQRTFCPAQEILDHDAPARVAKTALIHHLVDGGSRRSSISGNDDSLSQSKAVCFENNGKFQSFAVIQRFAAVGKRPRLGGWNFLSAHQFFREDFGCLEASRRFRRTKRAQFFTSKKIANPRNQRVIRSEERCGG